MKKLIAFLPVFIVVSAFATDALDVHSPKTIKSEKIEYDVKTGTIKTKGKTEITNAAGSRMTLQDSYLSSRGEQLSGDDVKIWLGQHVYIESNNITRNGDETIAKKAMFTACANCDDYGNAWEISASKIVHDMSDRMLSFHNMVFDIYDIPVLYFPYYTMPDPGVKHKSGLLTPSLQSTNKMGTQINLPVYVSFSDTHDATLTLSYLTKENPLIQLEHRLNLAHSEYRTRGSYTHNRAGDDRWHIFNDDIIEMGEYARASVFIARASDKTYLQKYGFYEDQPYLDSGAKVEIFGQSGYVVADTHVFQELRSDGWMGTVPSGNILPNIRGVYQTSPLFAETYMTLSGDVLSVVDKGTSSQRMVGESRITSPWTLWGGNRLTASIAARYDVYNFHNTDMVDGDKFSGLKNRFLPNGYVEWGLPFVKPGAGWSQTIEPRARLTMMRRTDDDQFALSSDSAGTFLSDTVLFSNNRFAGYDLWENGTFADYGVRWSAFNNDGRTVEIFLGQSHDFTDRAATDLNSGFHKNGSDYVGRVGFNNSDWLDISSRFRFDRDSLNLRHAETSAVIGSAANYFTIGHIWARQFLDAQTLAPDINEAMAGLGFRLTDRWSVRFDAIYNWTEDTFLRHSGTLFYNHPCYYLSFGYRRDNAVREDYQGNTIFQFRFGISIEGQKY